MNKIITLILIIYSTNILGQKNWKIQTSKKGKIIVKNETTYDLAFEPHNILANYSKNKPVFHQ
ncbi:hypothetical protein [uncultured Tenacibaculum sp.]|uniref:hypothetical protein n=1 Tax=uncultured Tenacibaculum sp. TaxID=174713 RepID=UPI002614E40F|nr:hypothetical protein [uncultured Tenacibaculum sp.]